MAGTSTALVVLDVNGTLSDPAPLRASFERAGAPPGSVASWLAATLRDGFALTAAGGYAEFEAVARGALRELLAAAGTPAAEFEGSAERILAHFQALGVHGDVPDGLRRLQKGGVRVSTLSNGSAGYAEALLERAGLDALVDRHLSVGEVGRWKPAPEPYLHAVRSYGAEPEEATLIAAHPWDVDGAKRAGLGAVWLDRAGAPYPEPLRSPDATIGALDAFPLDGAA